MVGEVCAWEVKLEGWRVSALDGVERTSDPRGRKTYGSEAIGGAHYGPVNVYLSQVSDASTADGSTPWYKIFADSWSAKGSVGDGDNWGTNDLNSCCGKMDVPIPADTQPMPPNLRV